MCIFRHLTAAAISAMTLLTAAPIAIAGETRSVASMKALRDAGLVRQQRDYSCGAAALATILRYGFEEDLTEADLLADLFSILREDERDIRRDEGFSLLDLQRVAAMRGYRAEGFRVRPSDLPKLTGPVIVYVEPAGYKHFAVLRGVTGDRAHLADPSQGNMRLPMYRFLERWLGDDGRGIVFVVEPSGAPRAAGAVGGPMIDAPHIESVAATNRLAAPALAQVRQRFLK